MVWVEAGIQRSAAVRARFACVAILAALVALALPADAAVANKGQADVMDVAEAMTIDTSRITGASYVEYAGDFAVGVSDATITNEFGVPDGNSFSILTNGLAAFADDPNNNRGTGFPHGGACVILVRGACDVTILKIDYDVPQGHDCLAIEFQFLSEEYPEYIESPFNDAFIAEVDDNTWSANGQTISAPDNFAYDVGGAPITVRSASMTAAKASGSTYDGGTSRFMAQSPVTSGAHSVYLSIFDASDGNFDSAVFLDSLQTYDAPPDGCTPGALIPDPPPVADFTWSPNYICVGDPITFTDLSTASAPWSIANSTWDMSLAPGDVPVSYEQPWQDTHEHPGAPSPGAYEVTLTVFDEQGFSADVTKTINVNECPPPPNDPPSIDPIAPQFVAVGQTVSFVVSGRDPDGDPIAYSSQDLPAGAEFDPATRTFTWASSEPGVFDGLRFRVTEQTSLARWDETTAWIQVDPAPRAVTNADADGDGTPDGADDCPSCNLEEHSEWYEAGLPANATEEKTPPSNGPPPRTIGLDPLGDVDDDGVLNTSDNCVKVGNARQADLDGDGLGDACDADIDGDHVPNTDTRGRPLDNCIYTVNPLQEDRNGDGIGDACQGDVDDDGVPDADDNCPQVPNPMQEDTTGDGVGDACTDAPDWTSEAAPPGPDDPDDSEPNTSASAPGATIAWIAGSATLLILLGLGLLVLRRRA